MLRNLVYPPQLLSEQIVHPLQERVSLFLHLLLTDQIALHVAEIWLVKGYHVGQLVLWK